MLTKGGSEIDGQWTQSKKLITFIFNDLYQKIKTRRTP